MINPLTVKTHLLRPSCCSLWTLIGRRLPTSSPPPYHVTSPLEKTTGRAVLHLLTFRRLQCPSCAQRAGQLQLESRGASWPFIGFTNVLKYWLKGKNLFLRRKYYLPRRNRKKSPIFAHRLQLLPRGTLSSELFEFFRNLYPFQRYATF